MAARRRREPTGMSPCVRSSSRSSRRVETVLGPSIGGGGGGGGGEDPIVVFREASSRLEADVFKVEEMGWSCNR